MFPSRGSVPLAITLAVVVACASSPGAVDLTAERVAAPTDELGSALDSYLQRAAAFGFNGTFLVAKDGRVIVHDGYGLADREHGTAVSTETVFDIGSITKQFTAAAILRLEERGRLRVEDSIGRFFSDVPADKRPITLHHLLTHTSGLIGDLGGDYQVMPRDSLVRLALASDLQWAPGTRYDYSNLGYSLLGAIVEIASGQPYERFLHDQLLRPAGMQKTGYRIPQWAPHELAVGYRGDQRWGTPLDHEWAADGPWWNLRANGGILSTMDDLYRWHQALDSDVVLSTESRARMFAPHVAEDEEGSSHYGYGWAIFTTPRGTRLIAHNGGNGYFFADLLRYVDERVVIIMATNAENHAVIAVRQRVIDAVFSGHSPKAPPVAATQLASSDLERYAGSYALPSGALIVVSVSGGQIVADAVGQDATELLSSFSATLLPEHRELSQRSITIFEGASTGDLSGLRAASDSPERSEATLRRIWRAAEENMGAYRSFDVLGTVPSWWSGEPSPVTFVRLNFERGSRLFRLHWENGRIAGFGGMLIPNPARATLLPQGDHRFIGYNLGIEHPVQLRFETSANAAISGIAIVTADGERRGIRQRE